MIKNKTLFISLLLLLAIPAASQNIREKSLFNNGWKFAYGNASSMEKDYTHGIEYFTYYAKARAFDHNKGPIYDKFDDSSWQRVNLPHDWVVDLPFSAAASHSHGYKTIGWRYPETSVGWYRKSFNVDSIDFGKHFYIQFDGIFRNCQVFCNSFYLGHELSGYATQTYDLTEYLNYGGENIITVRVDASTEEGWFYEGAGIYRNVWLYKVNKLHVAPFGTYIVSRINEDYSAADIDIEVTLENKALTSLPWKVVNRVVDKTGAEVARSEGKEGTIIAKDDHCLLNETISLKDINLWSLESPYLYTLYTDVYSGDVLTDTYSTSFGIRSIEFHPEKGFLLNGKSVKLLGANLHQDHAGVGSGISDKLWEYRVRLLKEYGHNAIRSSHNPATPALLDICDSLGILMIDENRMAGINNEHFDLVERMIRRDRNHPCIILWSVWNEEWAMENTIVGTRISESLSAFVHGIDPTRLTTCGNAGGRTALFGVDVKGYNYIRQNPIDEFHKKHPEWPAVCGTEQSSGCGTRNIYKTDPSKGWMESINRSGDVDGITNIMAYGWQFYADRPWTAGIFYWTGMDYRGEPNPMSYPATGSTFGMLDYCGFPKDEAFYLKSWWTNEPVLYLSPHWNHPCAEGETIAVWAYSNCDAVELFVNGRSRGKQQMSPNGYLEWKVPYKPGNITAQGWKNGKKSIKTVVETTSEATNIVIEPVSTTMRADGQDICIVNLSLRDSKGREVPDAMNPLTVSITGPATILGYGNGDPGFKDIERPLHGETTFPIKAFCGKAQIILRSIEGQKGEVTLTISSDGIKTESIFLTTN